MENPISPRNAVGLIEYYMRVTHNIRDMHIQLSKWLLKCLTITTRRDNTLSIGV
jgi:hypothetical protein